MERVLIVGASTRAAAESAARAGFAVTSIDAYADLDQHPSVRALSAPRDFGVPFSAAAAARIAQSIACDAVAYLSSFENHPRAVGTLAGGRTLWGNAPDVLRRVRDPFVLAEALRRHGVVVPAVRTNANDPNDSNDPNDPNNPNDPNDVIDVLDWLVKPRASGGGHGVKEWRRGTRLARRHYLQQRIDGTPGSIVFAAAHGRSVPIGFSRQLVGHASFGAPPWRYCGSITAPPEGSRFRDDGRLFATACTLAEVAAREFALAGVNGIDFIAANGVPFPIEVNPRWSSSMELVERAYGLSVFAAHAAACARTALPSFDLSRARQSRQAFGKAIVFARRDVTMGDTSAWLRDADVRDVPRRGDRIRAGQPVCTVFAESADETACEAELVARAARIYTQLDEWQREAA